LRAALRLALGPEVADAAVAGNRVDLTWHELRGIAMRAVASYRWTGLKRRLRRSSDGPVQIDRPLPPGSTSPSGAIGLALHLGLDLPVPAVAELLGVEPEQLSSRLDQARRAVDPSLPVPCDGYGGLVARYRDESLDADERLALFTHLHGCEGCRAIVEQSRAIDADLLDEIATQQRALPALSSRGHALPARVQRGGLLLTAAMVSVGVLALATIAISRLTGEPHEPVPLSVDAGHDLRGWLIVADGGGAIEARNLATRERRLLSVYDGQPSAAPLLSPNQQMLATCYWGVGPTVPDLLIISSLGGEIVRTFEWGSAGADPNNVPVGWLNDSAFLMRTAPERQVDETDQEYQSRRDSESSLLRLDIITRQQRTIMTGVGALVDPAPDGSAIALVRAPRTPSLPETLEIVPVADGSLGEPVARLEGIAPHLGGVWAPDASRYYAWTEVQRAPTAEAQPTAGPTTSAESPSVSRSLVALDRIGAIHTVVEPSGDRNLVLLEVSPDGTDLILARAAPGSIGLARFAYWRVPSAGGEPVELADAGEWQGDWWQRLVWSPDALTMLVTDVEPFQLPLDPRDRILGEVYATTLLAVERGGAIDVLETWFTDSVVLVAWLPESALPGRRSAQAESEQPRFTRPEPIPRLSDDLCIDGDSVVSADGNHVALTDVGAARVAIWSNGSARVRALAAGIDDPALYLDPPGVVGVSVGMAEDTVRTRLTLFALEASALEYRRFDPARLGDASDWRYTNPLIAPNGAAVAFFLVNADERSVALWVAPAHHEAHEVTRWTLPENAIVDPPLVAVWSDARTLTYVMPGDWQHGMPRLAVLSTVTIEETGELPVTRLLELHPRGGDVGVAVSDLSLSPDRADLVYRLRHYTERASDDGRYDTIHIARTSDISQQFELARSSIGYGIAWSPDGHWLVAALRGRLVLLSVDGRVMEYLTDAGAYARYPLWVGDDELWFSLDDGSGERVARMRVK
jgi:hypothetical protein